MGYKVKLNVFEGPFDLLVYLIENARMSIYDINVSEITDQYMEHINEMKNNEIALASEFMVLAATLINIKSKMLLPRISAEGEESTEEDPRTELVEKLLEYKRFKAAAEMLEEKEEEGLGIFEKPQEDISRYTDEPDEYLSLDIRQFVGSFTLFLARKKRVEEIRKDYGVTERQKITTEQRISYIKNTFKKLSKKSIDFRDVVPESGDRYDIVLTFVSVLEMIRQKTIKVTQKSLFGRITLTQREENKKTTKEAAGDEQ